LKVRSTPNKFILGRKFEKKRKIKLHKVLKSSTLTDFLVEKKFAQLNRILKKNPFDSFNLQST